MPMSAWILPQLKDNSENKDGLVITDSEGSWVGKFDEAKVCKEISNKDEF